MSFLNPQDLSRLKPTTSRAGLYADFAGRGLQQGISWGLNFLLQKKLHGMKEKAAADSAYAKASSPVETASDINKYANALGYKDLTPEQKERILTKALEKIQKTGNRHQSIADSFKEFHQEEDSEPNSESVWKKLLTPTRDESKSRHERSQEAIEKLFSPKETPESKRLSEDAAEKARQGQPIENYTPGELSRLKGKDIERNYSPEDQEKFFQAAQYYAKRNESINKAATVPFIGGQASDSFRQALDPNLPRPSPLAGASRTLNELALLGASTGLPLAGQIGADAGLFGGTGAINEALRTAGTPEEYNVGNPLKEAAVGAAIPPLGAALSKFKFIRKYASNLLNRIKKGKTKQNIEAAAEDLASKASAKGIDVEAAATGNPQAKKELEDFTATQLKELTPNPIRPTAEKEPAKRFAQEAKTLAKTPIEKYLEPPTEKLSAKKIPAVRSQLNAVKKEISQLEKDVLKNKGPQLKETQNKLNSLRNKEYELDHLIREGKLPRTAAQLEKAARESAENVINKVLSGSPEAKKAIETNTKTMDTFLKRAQSELVRGKLPPQKAFDQFISVNKAHLDAYKTMLKEVKEQLRTPNSNLYGTGLGGDIVKEFEKRIKGLEAALRVQQQKKIVQNSLKGGMGKFYRSWVNQIRGDQRLLRKDMFRLDDAISKGEKDISKIAQEKLFKQGKEAAQGNKIKAAFQREGATPKQADQLNNIYNKEKSEIKENVSKVKSHLKSEAENNKTSLREEVQSFGEKIQSPNGRSQIKKKANLRKRAKERTEKWLGDSLVKQSLTGLMLGALSETADEGARQIFGKTIPHGYKLTGFYATVGLSPFERGKIPVSLGFSLGSYGAKETKKAYQKNRYNNLTSRQKTKYREYLKKKGYSDKYIDKLQN